MEADAEDTLWAIRILGEFIQEEIDNRSSVGDDQAEYRAAPREAFAAFNLLRAAAIRNEIRNAQRQHPEPSTDQLRTAKDEAVGS